MVGMSVLGLAGRAVYVPPFDGEAVEGWGTQAFLPLPVMESCAEHREAARSDHTPRSGRPARSGPVRQDTCLLLEAAACRADHAKQAGAEQGEG